MSEVNLSKAVRSNLLSLQSTAAQMGKTQERLATGLKGDTALDNPTNVTAASLNSRASDMANLLDSMSNGIKTIEAADNGLTSITKTVESMQSTLLQARQDKSFNTSSYTIDGATIGTASTKTLSFEGGAVGATPVSVDLNTVSAAATPATSTISTDGVPAVTGTVKTTDALVEEINSNTSLQDKIRASNDSGKLAIENLSTEDLTVTGVGSDGEVDGTTGESTIGGNDVRKNLVTQFNDLRDQLDKLADDASFNGINLLGGDKLTLTFNETGTSTIDIQAQDADGSATSVNSSTLGITTAADSDFDSDASIDARLSTLSDALGSLRSQASSFGSNLSIVENRTNFTKNMINTLETGAANLTLADTNEEAANLLALQTRQQLSSTALSMASQADQAVLRLF